MREITPRLTAELQENCDWQSGVAGKAIEVSTYRVLVEHVAKLSYINRDELLFFRGQDKDYQSRTGGTTLYPAIYRGDAVPSRELRHRFDLLDQAARLLIERFKNAGIDGHSELRRKRYIQWSMFSVRRPIDVVVLNDCVTETKVTEWPSKTSTSFEKSISERLSRSIL